MYLVIRRNTDCLESDIDEFTFAAYDLDDIKEKIMNTQSKTRDFVEYSVFKLHSKVLVEPPISTIKYTHHLTCV